MTTPLRRSSRLAASTSLVASTVVGVTRTSHTATVAAVQGSDTRAKQSRHTHTQAVAKSGPVEKQTRSARKRARNPSLDSSDLTALSEDDTEAVIPTRKVKASRKKVAAIEYTLADFPKRSESPWKIGPHVSAAGGVQNTILNAASIGATAFALFMKSQRKWDSPPLTQESIDSFKKRLGEFNYDSKHILPHGNYLINLGNPDENKRAKSYDCFVDDLKRCEQLGLLLYNFHPGSSVGQGTTDDSLTLIAECINRAHKETERIITVIETMVGAGSVVGSKFSEIGRIIEQVEDKSRVGVCIDTCHVFAAGYDIRTEEGWNVTMDEFERQIGFKYLRGMHLNDSKAALGSRKDRHENIGLGHLGLQTFAHILNDRRTRDIPLILETPAFEPTAGARRGNQFRPGEGWDVWATEVKVLQRLAGALGENHKDVGESARQDEGADEKVDLEAWTEEIRAVVKSAGVKLDKDAGVKKQGAKKQAKKAKNDEDHEEAGDSCDEL